MKIIFLDIDGVLNGYNFWSQLGWELICLTGSLKLKKWYLEVTNPFGIHIKKFKRLVKIVHETNAKIVLSSSWRWKLTQSSLNKLSEDEKIFLKLCKENNIEIFDNTPRSKNNRRDEEISMWLNNYNKKIKKYNWLIDNPPEKIDKFVILEDERLECFIGKGLVQTSSLKKGQIIKGYWYENTGLKNKHVRQAIKILNEG